jgi:hypothetical protein
VASIPLLDGGELVGIANCCRHHGAFTPIEGAFLRSLSLPLGSLLMPLPEDDTSWEPLVDGRVVKLFCPGLGVRRSMVCPSIVYWTLR